MISYEQYLYAGGILFLFVLSTSLVVALIIAKNKNKKLEEKLSDREEIANESYLKFLTTSRNEAFTYIVEVQEKLGIFKEKIEAQLNYFNTYGRVVVSPHTIMLEKIDSAYEELKTILPQENKEKQENE
jgi:hypothetical protein